MVGQKPKKYQEILKSKIDSLDGDPREKAKYEMDLVTGHYMPKLIEGECPNCEIKLAIHDFCKKIVCPICGVLIDTE